MYSLRGVLLSLGALLVGISAALQPSAWLLEYVSRDEWLGSLVAAGGGVALAGFTLPHRPGLAKFFAAFSLALFVIVSLPGLQSRPGWALLTWVAVVGVGLRLRHTRIEPLFPLPSGVLEHPRLWRDSVLATSVLALVTWLLVARSGIASTSLGKGAALAVYGVAIAHTMAWIFRTLPLESARTRWIFLVLPPILIVSASFGHRPVWAFTWLALHQMVVLVLLQVRRSESAGGMLSQLIDHPARLLVSTFLVICIGGGLALALPPAANVRGAVVPIDALFTSVSATCVTELVVLDTAKDFSVFGQVVILGLIQVGGLGMMTFSTAGVLLLGRRLGMRHELAVGGILTDENSGGDLYVVARRILVTTFAIEGIGALILAGLFVWGGDSIGMALWRGVFTSISAFCNAGFGLQTDNMIPYQRQPFVLHTVALLIILGGLGTPVIHAVPQIWRGKRVSLQAKLVLVTTLVLLVVPAILIAVFEWNHTLANLGVMDRLHNAWFQSVVPRTAGFNSIDYTVIRPETITLTLILMFIGGSPFSTAGGVKTTTIALIAAAVYSAVRGRSAATAFGRTISHESIYKSIAIMSMGTLFVILGFGAIQLTQGLPYESGLFEVVSALGTVGLSIGATPRLDEVGKIVIMVCMFAGRVGPLTLFLLLSERRREPKWAYPEEKVTVG